MPLALAWRGTKLDKYILQEIQKNWKTLCIAPRLCQCAVSPIVAHCVVTLGISLKHVWRPKCTIVEFIGLIQPIWQVTWPLLRFTWIYNFNMGGSSSSTALVAYGNMHILLRREWFQGSTCMLHHMKIKLKCNVNMFQDHNNSRPIFFYFILVEDQCWFCRLSPSGTDCWLWSLVSLNTTCQILVNLVS